MSAARRLGQRVGPLERVDVTRDGRLLSVQEVQRLFREERGRRALPTAPDDGPHGSSAAEQLTSPRAVAPTQTERHRQAAREQPAAAPTATVGARPAERTARDLQLAPSWVRVIAGHGGAGSSTLALAIADAASAAGRQVHLIEAAHPSRSGLVAASSAELGLDESGVWRRGIRSQLAREGQVTVLRRADDAHPRGWPVLNAGAAHAAPRPDAGPVSCPLVAVDLGLVPLDAVASLGHPGIRVVIACRTTIPGVRLTEQLLASLGDVHLVVGMLGPRRWPGEVSATAGPRLRALRDHDRVVPVPRDRHLEVTGPTYAPLPRAVLAAGRELLRVLEAEQYSARGGRA